MVGGIGFYAGIKYQQLKGASGRFGNFQGVRSGQPQRGLGRPVNGEIISSDDKTITVKLQDGSSKIVLFSDKTSINKASEGSMEDLRTGVRVAAFGVENSDGSITATNIQINPVLGGMGNRTTVE